MTPEDVDAAVAQYVRDPADAAARERIDALAREIWTAPATAVQLVRRLVVAGYRCGLDYAIAAGGCDAE